MAIQDNLRLVVKVCKLYYEGALSQKEISCLLGISRPQISRILEHAKASGIVKITIRDTPRAETDLELALCRTYGLSDAFVVDTGGAAGLPPVFAEQCAAQLENYIPDNASVGVMSGKTVASVVAAIPQFRRHGLTFVPLIGGFGSEGADWHANVIARQFAQKARGEYLLLNVPVLVQSEAVRDMLVREPEIAQVLERGARCDVELIGIGQISPRSTSYQSGAFGEGELNELLREGAVASVCTSHLNKDGQCIETPLAKRSIGQPVRRQRTAKVIAMATGKSKLEAVRATLKGGYVDVLMTSLDLAEKLLKQTR